MRVHHFVLFLSTLSVVGCFGDLNGVKIKHDGGGGDEDLSVPDDSDGGTDPDLRANGDAGKTDGSTATCDFPYLGVLIDSDGSSSHARVERIPLDGRPACKALTLGNSLPSDLTALGFLPPSTIAVGGINIVYQIGPTDKAAAQFFVGDTSYAYGVPVDDLFGIIGTDGKQYLGVAYDGQQFTSTGNDIAYLAILLNGEHVVHWSLATSSGDIRTSDEVRSITRSSRDPKKIFIDKGLTDPFFAAAEVTPPWDGNPVEAKTPYYQGNLGTAGEALTVRTLRTQSGSEIVARTAWTFRANFDTPYQVYYLNDHPSSGKDLQGPLMCDLPKCSTMTSDPLRDAVPDPMNLDAVIAICTDPQTSSSHDKTHVVRMKSDGSCEMILDGDTLLTGDFPTRLTNAIIEP